MTKATITWAIVLMLIMLLLMGFMELYNDLKRDTEEIKTGRNRTIFEEHEVGSGIHTVNFKSEFPDIVTILDFRPSKNSSVSSMKATKESELVYDLQCLKFGASEYTASVTVQDSKRQQYQATVKVFVVCKEPSEEY